MRKLILIGWLVIISVCIGGFFWYNEWKFNLPTPVPKNYAAINLGSYVDVAPQLKFRNNKPTFLHFFNPDCPCSKFNVPHFASLVKQYSNKANFAIVVMSDKKYTQQEIQKKFDVDIPVLFDSAVAAKCGVYSTPQAVILNKNSTLFYRGNYNRARYCTDAKSNYAQIALDSLLDNNTSIVFNQYALTAYGCQLPKCNK